MRIAVVTKDRCRSDLCSLECISYCPVVRNGVICIELTPGKKARVHEDLCIGCGICVHKCPFQALRIINLAEDLGSDLIHQYGENGFRLFHLPVPKPGRVTGILGANGTGKTTVLNILSGRLTPNFGWWDDPPDWDEVVEVYPGVELKEYFRWMRSRDFRAAVKPQGVDRIPAVVEGSVRSVLERKGEDIDEVASMLNLTSILDRDVAHISGGELQMMAVAAAMLTDADVYLFDEPSSYLDIYQRLAAARAIKRISRERMVVIVEHDLAILDFLADDVHIVYGEEGSYGVVTPPRQVRTAINVYLEGFLREENVKFRDIEVRFDTRPPRDEWRGAPLIAYPDVKISLDGFGLDVEAGHIRSGEVVGVMGPNATGKTTFVRMLSGDVVPEGGALDLDASVVCKPQYITTEYDGTVEMFLNERLKETMGSSLFERQVIEHMGVRRLFPREVSTLSGGELQRLMITLTLGLDADLYLFDEPSAHLDANQRITTAKVIRRMMESRGRTALVVDHDVYFIDSIADRIMVFDGEPAVHGLASGPFPMREGMNRFLSRLDITFRRDAETRRPRINKPGSVHDREQHESGEYYYDA